MELERRVKILENVYVGLQVDAVRCFANEGILDKVTEQKKKEQLAFGKLQAERLGMQKPDDVFVRLPEIFNCALWEIQTTRDGFTAETKACKLCAAAKKWVQPALAGSIASTLWRAWSKG